MIFPRLVPIHRRFTKFNLKCLFWGVTYLNNLVATKRAFFNVGLKIQNGCQTRLLIAAQNCLCYIINYFERNCMAISMTKQTVFHSWMWGWRGGGRGWWWWWWGVCVCVCVWVWVWGGGGGGGGSHLVQ